MAKWRDLIPPSEEVIIASNGSFETPERIKPELGWLVLTKNKVYIIYSRGLTLTIPKLEEAIPLPEISDMQITGEVIRSLEFDFPINTFKKHVKFTSFDFEVRELLAEIEYAVDNP